MCILTEQQRRQVYLRCNAIRLQKLVELCLNPTSGITIEGLRDAGYRKVDQLAELCHHQELIECSQSECNVSETLEKEWNSIIQMPNNEEKIECLNKFVERLYTYDLILARKYRMLSESLLEELGERIHPIFGIIDTMRFEWEEAKESNTIEGYTRFISRNPNSVFQEEAERRIQYMMFLLDDLKNNPSKYGREKMFDIISNNKLTREDLVYNSGILTDRAYDHIRQYPHLKDEQRELPISRIENPRSKDRNLDVMFWGLPGSGVTCLLSGLLGLVGNLGFNLDLRGTGDEGRLAMELSNYTRCSMLPPHSLENYIQVIDAYIKDARGSHNISLIEMSGEGLRNFALMDKHANLEDLGIGASTLLSNNNKKVICFIIEPFNEKTIAWSDSGKPIKVKQSDVIQSVLATLQTNLHIMKRIEHIHFILTKSDMLGENINCNEIPDILIQQGFMDCFQYTKSVCEKYGINSHIGFNVRLYPFSLGKFMPGDVYEYDETDSLRILQSLLTPPIQPCVYGPPPPGCLLGKLINLFKS